MAGGAQPFRGARVDDTLGHFDEKEGWPLVAVAPSPTPTLSAEGEQTQTERRAAGGSVDEPPDLEEVHVGGLEGLHYVFERLAAQERCLVLTCAP